MWIRTSAGTLVNMDRIQSVQLNLINEDDEFSHQVILCDETEDYFIAVDGDEEKCQKYVKELARELNVFSVEGTHPCACGQCDCKEMVIDSMLICDHCQTGLHEKDAYRSRNLS